LGDDSVTDTARNIAQDFFAAVSLMAAGLALQPAFSSTTRLVVVPAVVTDAGNRPVAGLGPENFRILDEGRAQRIVMFSREDAPISLGLLVDHSLSMRSKRNAVEAAVSTFAAGVRPNDELFLFHFNDRVATTLFDGRPFTSKAEELTADWSRTLPAGGTALYDAVIEGLTRLGGADRPKRALIVVTDGEDNASRHGPADTVALARRSNAVIYAIGIAGGDETRRVSNVLAPICAASGGGVHFTVDPLRVAELLDIIGRELRAQYVMAFDPGDTPRRGEHRLEVRVEAPGRGRLHVRSRSVYTLDAP
jgi:Ca-activated chloride channel homolog